MTMQKMGGRNERKSTQLVRSSVGDEVDGDDDRRFQEEEEENGTGEGKGKFTQKEGRMVLFLAITFFQKQNI